MWIDEMLIAFRGKCKFRMYMPNKPAKYGLKIQAMTDARIGYFYNAYIYTGANSDGEGLTRKEQKLLKSTQTVIRLIKPIENTHRNITADNWYTSIELVKELKTRGLTFLGTVNKNKREIPKEFLPNRNREVASSIYGFTEDMTLVSYVPKKNRSVILVSSMHHEAETDSRTRKPEMIMLYNKTKGGVDSMDFKISTYSSNRRSRRWPLTLFYAILNISCANSFILKKHFPGFQKNLQRLDFTKQLAKSLVVQHMRNRLESKKMPREISLGIRRILGISNERPEQPKGCILEKRVVCSTCPPRLMRKTRYACKDCGSGICLECSRFSCKNCALRNNDRESDVSDDE